MIAWLDPRGLNVESSTGQRRRLLVAASTACAPECASMSFAWSPDSRSIAVGGAGLEANHLMAVNVATREIRDIAPVYRYTQYVVIGWSPNGRYLAYGRLSGLEGTASCCKSWLVVADGDGRHSRRLFSFADAIHDGPSASWSPNSRSIAFTSDGRDRRDPRFAIVDVESGTTNPIGGFDPEGSPPVWSPSGRQVTAVLYVNVSQSAVNTFDLATRALTRVGYGSVPIEWYSDGAIVTVGGATDNRVFSIDTLTRTERALFTLPAPLEISSVDPAPTTS